MLAGRADAELAIEALHEGAQDYLNKTELSGDALVRAMRYASERHRLWIQRKEMEEQLRHAQKLEAVGQLTAGVAHNFNNILQAILGNLQLALFDNVPASTRELLDLASEDCERGAGIIRQLMVFTRGASAGEHASTDIVLVLSRVVEICRRTFDKRIDIQLAEPSERKR